MSEENMKIIIQNSTKRICYLNCEPDDLIETVKYKV